LLTDSFRREIIYLTMTGWDSGCFSIYIINVDGMTASTSVNLAPVTFEMPNKIFSIH